MKRQIAAWLRSLAERFYFMDSVCPCCGLTPDEKRTNMTREYRKYLRQTAT